MSIIYKVHAAVDPEATPFLHHFEGLINFINAPIYALRVSTPTLFKKQLPFDMHHIQ